MSSLALFDFDGTVTTRDTFLEFIKFYRGNWRFWLGMLSISPWLVGLKLKAIPNQKVKEKALLTFFKNEPIAEFDRLAALFCEQKVPQLIKADALSRIQWHKSQGHRVIIVSASLENWIEPWANKQGIEVIASIPEINEGKISGKLIGKNCHGEEKTCRVREKVSLTDYQSVYAYGDTSGDKEMLQMADHPHYRHFKG